MPSTTPGSTEENKNFISRRSVRPLKPGAHAHQARASAVKIQRRNKARSWINCSMVFRGLNWAKRIAFITATFASLPEIASVWLHLQLGINPKTGPGDSLGAG